MANMPSIKKSKVSLQLDNNIIVALDFQAKRDGTSRNAVANYYLSHALTNIIKSFNKEQKEKVIEMERKNMEGRK